MTVVDVGVFVEVVVEVGDDGVELDGCVMDGAEGLADVRFDAKFDWHPVTATKITRSDSENIVFLRYFAIT
jgi:hypothetical protein